MRVVITKVLPDHMTFDSRLERDEGESHTGIWGICLPSKGNSMCKDFQ